MASPLRSVYEIAPRNAALYGASYRSSIIRTLSIPRELDVRPAVLRPLEAQRVFSPGNNFTSNAAERSFQAFGFEIKTPEAVANIQPKPVSEDHQRYIERDFRIRRNVDKILETEKKLKEEEFMEEGNEPLHGHFQSVERKNQLTVEKRDTTEKISEDIEAQKTHHCEKDKDERGGVDSGKVSSGINNVSAQASENIEDVCGIENKAHCMEPEDRKKAAQEQAQKIVDTDKEIRVWEGVVKYYGIEIPKEDADKLQGADLKNKKSAEILVKLSKIYDLGIDNYLGRLLKIASYENKTNSAKKDASKENKPSESEKMRSYIMSGLKILIDYIERLNEIGARDIKQAIINFIRRMKEEEKELEAHLKKLNIKKKDERKLLGKIMEQKYFQRLATAMRVFNKFIAYSR